MAEETAVTNNDRELWREPAERPGMEHYAPSIHVTGNGGIGINVGGSVIVKSLAAWHALAMVEVRQAFEEQRLKEAAEAYLAQTKKQTDTVN